MASTRKFYRTTIVVEVLSEEPLPNDISLGAIAKECIYGNWSMGDLNTTEQEVDGPTMAKLLQDQASEAGFFQLTEDGEDAEV